MYSYNPQRLAALVAYALRTEEVDEADTEVLREFAEHEATADDVDEDG